MQSCAGKARRNGFAPPILKLANLRASFRVIAVARVKFWLRSGPRYSWRLFGGRTEASLLCRILWGPSNVGTRSAKRDSYLCRGRCAMLSAFIQHE
ncbi:hypothetical protein BDA96_03G077600 [Sorghum bicolor]|uniref:Uncharacterized protein n=1 Tax=Sorghum bicolor TaxID=4558 RepID=A0A921RCN5_SORBI|nr:hypothetical protein BDA96_03G077600 [Sorghum bicolor]